MCSTACQTHSPLPGCSISLQPAWAPCFPCFQSVLIFSICLSEYNESLYTHKSTVSWRRSIELAPVKCTKLHCRSETELNLAGLPGAYTLNRGIDCFNPARLLSVRDNNLLSYSEITFVLRSCAIVLFNTVGTKVLSNFGALFFIITVNMQSRRPCGISTAVMYCNSV